jgi:hypothetical protein
MPQIDNDNQLLRETLGKNRCDVIATTAMTSNSYNPNIRSCFMLL